jgi:D-tyrosyl-tRNA(Tyr) deacylase
MRVVLQRVARASVSIDSEVVGAIGAGLLVFVGFTHDDGVRETAWMAEKVVGLRIFSDDDGRMNQSVLDVSGSILIVSQFTLYGDARKGRRPSFVDAARPEVAIPLYEAFVSAVRSAGVNVATGEFGADMQVELVNDGPVTLSVERAAGGSG